MKTKVGKIRQFKDYGSFLFSKASLPTKRFVLFGNGRSGSTLLVSLLNSSDQVYCDGEILNRPAVISPNLFIKVQASHCPKPVYGFKLLDYQLKDLQGIREPAKFLMNLYSEGWKFIYLIRRNKLNYALSILNAFHRENFHHRDENGKLTRQKLRVDVDELLYWVRQGEENTRYYDDILQHIPHLKLTYEDNLRDSHSHQNTANQVFDFLDLPRCEVESNLVKLMPSDPMQMVENREDLVKTLEMSEYTHFLEST